MQDDKNFKEILKKGALEETSPDFTAAIMRRIKAVAVIETSHQPLINPKIKLAFIIVFVTVLSALFAISIFISPADLPFNFLIRIPTISIDAFYDTVYFVITFWLLVFLNYYLNERNLRNNGFN